MNNELLISDYNYPLPEDRIAKFPLERREMSKLLVYEKGGISESRFARIGEALPAGAMLVFNNTKVIRARLVFYKPTGARIEIFCLEPHDPADYERAFAVKGSCRWSCIVGNLKKWKDDELHIDFEAEGRAQRLTARKAGQTDKEQIIEFSWNGDQSFGQLLEALGRIPIPPYLCRESEELDNSRYQTVYSKFEGSVAAPTAGLHFTPEIIAELRNTGHLTDEVTLHVGAGTFLPVKTDEVTRHKMHTEHFEIRLSTIRNLIDHLGEVIAVGTTSCRTLESVWAKYGKIVPCSGNTSIFIYPGIELKAIDGLITNFHLPESTLIMLISAFYGYDKTMAAYKVAVEEKYRFFSFGDAMFIK